VDLINYLQLALIKYAENIVEMQEFFPVVIGEWCLSHHSTDMGKLSSLQKQYAYRAVADTQLYVWEKVAGWFFWSYKLLPDVPGWDLRECVKNGWFPTNFETGS
jgi:glucan 1,3-beta-glucosidase